MTTKRNDRAAAAARPDLEAIKARAAAATEGPWEVNGDHGLWSEGLGVWVMQDDCLPGGTLGGGDAEFIAHAREDIPALLAEVERLRKFAQRTQERDWARLDGALSKAINGTWSMGCGWIVYAIVDSHAVTGAWTPDTEIPYGPLLLDGIYEAITGIPVNEETLTRCREYFAPFERHVFAESAPAAQEAAEQARRELDEAASGEQR